jgi:hypothetical protein
VCLSFNAVAEIFLAECLGGRYEAIGEDFEGSSIQVPTGAEHVPSLAEKLTQRAADHGEPRALESDPVEQIGVLR